MSAKGSGAIRPAFAVVFVLNFLAVLVLCRYVFRMPFWTIAFFRTGTPSASNRRRARVSALPSSWIVTADEATFFPIFFMYGENPVSTRYADVRPPDWSIREPRMSGSNTMSYFPAAPPFGFLASVAIRPALWPALSGSNCDAFVAHDTPCPLDSKDTSARIERYNPTRSSVPEAPFDVSRKWRVWYRQNE